MNKGMQGMAKGMRGVTLIELMIALLIGTILVLGLVQVFSASRSAYLLSQGIARNQESSRFAIDFLTRDLRMAGHTGCVNDQSLLATSGGVITGGNIRSLFMNDADRNSNNVAGLLFPLRFDMAIQGFEANGTAPGETSAIPATPAAGLASDWTPALPTELAELGPVKGSDIVVLRFLSPEESPITTFNAGGTPAVVYPAASGALATAGSGLFAVADCRSATVFQASAAPSSTEMNVTLSGLNKSNLSFVSSQDGSLAYKAGSAALFRAESMVYYIRLSATTNEPALYRSRWIAAPGAAALTRVDDEMVDGIESMQLLFGRDAVTDPALPPLGNIATMDTAATINASTYGPAAAWRRVGAVQIGLLVRNSGERAASAQSADAQAVMQVSMPSPDDGNYRSTYETTVALRNRLYGN